MSSTVAPGKVIWHVAQVSAVHEETPTARRIELDIPTWPGNDAGAHLDVRLTAPDGYQAARSYSIASSGAGKRVVIAVDEVPDGEVSPYLVRALEVGDELEVRGPLGRFFLWVPSDEREPAPVQLIAGGSGVVPLYAMAAAHDQHNDGSEFRLLYSVRTSGDVFFREELDALTHTTVDLNYTRASDDATAPPGRLTQDKLAALTLPPESHPRIFVCGPTPFVEAVSGWLVALGHDPLTIRTERFGGTA